MRASRFRLLAAGAAAVVVAGAIVGPGAVTFTAAQTAPGDTSASTTCDFAAASEGWGLLSADQSRPFFEAPLPVDAAVPHVQTEITNNSAVGRGYLADPGIVGRGQVEAPRPIPPAEIPPVYTVPQPLFPASATVAQPGGERTASFGFGGAFDPTRQFAFGAARVEAEAAGAPSLVNVAANIEGLSFTPGPNEVGLAPPDDAGDGAVKRGFVTVGGVATRAATALEPDTGVVRGFASTTISDIEIAGIVRLRSFEVVAEALTGGAGAARRGVARVDGFQVAGNEVPFDETGLARAKDLLAAIGFELLPAQVGESSAAGEELVVTQGLVIRGENVDSSGERRRVNLVLGYAKASSKCLGVDDFGGAGSTPTSDEPPLDSTSVDGGFDVPAASDGSFDATLGNVQQLPPTVSPPAALPPTVALGPVARTGATRLSWRWDWGKLRLSLWPAGDIFTAVGTFGPFLLGGFLVRQRRRLRAG